MKTSKSRLSVLTVLTLALVLVASAVPSLAQEAKVYAEMSIEPTRIVWQPLVGYGGAVLTVVGSKDKVSTFEFGPDRQPELRLFDANGTPLPDGIYNYELMILRPDMAAPPPDFDLEQRGITPWEGTTEAVVESGAFSVRDGYFVTPDASEEEEEAKDSERLRGPAAIEDQVYYDDLIVVGSACVGQDCVNGESFGFDTIRLKENNLRIKFQDTSTSASFPSNDWQLTANDSSNGGANYFAIDDIDGGRTPFKVLAGAPTNSLYVDSAGDLGLGTSQPVVDIHTVSGNTPTLRLEQDGSSGFAAQTFDIAQNEANFFIRDVTNGSKLVFRIKPGAPTDSISIAADGDVGFGTNSPSGKVHIDDPNSGTGDVLLVVNNVGSSDPDILSLTDQGNLKVTATNADGKIEVERDGGSSAMFIAGPSMGQFGTTTNHMLGFLVNNVTVGFFDANGNLTITGQLNALSDAGSKENFAAVDGQSVLARLAEVPITTWNYKGEDDSVVHMGPTAQDFGQAFGLGMDDKHISIGDASGVALAAIQELSAQNQTLRAENEALSSRVDNLESRLAAVEAKVGGASSVSLPTVGLGLAALGLVGVVWVSRRRG